jgi:acetyl-CoA acetyltransferase
MMRVEGACASGGLALACGVDAIRAGADVVLVAGVPRLVYNRVSVLIVM